MRVAIGGEAIGKGVVVARAARRRHLPHKNLLARRVGSIAGDGEAGDVRGLADIVVVRIIIPNLLVGVGEIEVRAASGEVRIEGEAEEAAIAILVHPFPNIQERCREQRPTFVDTDEARLLGDQDPPVGGEDERGRLVGGGGGDRLLVEARRQRTRRRCRRYRPERAIKGQEESAETSEEHREHTEGWHPVVGGAAHQGHSNYAAGDNVQSASEPDKTADTALRWPVALLAPHRPKCPHTGLCLIAAIMRLCCAEREMGCVQPHIGRRNRLSLTSIIAPGADLTHTPSESGCHTNIRYGGGEYP